MSEVEDYELVNAASADILTGMVRDRIRLGWQPYGSGYTCARGWFYQPMVKYRWKADFAGPL